MNQPFIIYPAIDLIDGKCIRLTQGDYSRVKVYSEDPLEIANSFAQAGAQWIHIVDLDAAKTGIPTNHRIIARIAEQTGLKVQTGGGIRTMEVLLRILDSSVCCAILGTAAIRDRKFTLEALKHFASRVVIGIDAKNGKVAADGWTSESEYDAVDFAKAMEQSGARRIVYTDISRDGMLQGTNMEGLKTMISETSLEVIASGGIGSGADVRMVKEAGAFGVIIGKALYEGKVDLRQCLQIV
jgi:phosphoribosylformimino-5-aminoimidazole carboxamide ribotide isomerase